MTVCMPCVTEQAPGGSTVIWSLLTLHPQFIAYLNNPHNHYVSLTVLPSCEYLLAHLHLDLWLVAFLCPQEKQQQGAPPAASTNPFAPAAPATAQVTSVWSNSVFSMFVFSLDLTTGFLSESLIDSILEVKITSSTIKNYLTTGADIFLNNGLIYSNNSYFQLL